LYAFVIYGVLRLYPRNNGTANIDEKLVSPVYNLRFKGSYLKYYQKILAKILDIV